ncbi:MAG: LPP20 family lipoprotein [Schleiferiaceae bacterium]|nr:LPP20 family lipoprotein [Schleiferiaceae bacterium]
MRNGLIIFTSFILMACGGKKTVIPEWVTGKPIDPSGKFVYGLGMSYVNPNSSYQQAARSNALADLAQEVESQIFDETRLLQKEDAKGMQSAFSSETLTTSKVKLEDYQVIASYADAYRYYVLYKLHLPDYLENKANNDHLAISWIDEKIAIASDDSNLAHERIIAIGDAVHKAMDRNFLIDPTFAVDIKTKLIRALRAVEGDLQGNYLTPESIFYLGMPQQFSTIFKVSDSSIFKGLTLNSSSGNFSLAQENGAVICQHTGKQNAVKLNLSIDYKELLPYLDRPSVYWIQNMSGWNKSTTLYFQNTTVQVNAENGIKEVVGSAIAKSFTMDENAPLTLVFNGDIRMIVISNERSKCVIQGQFILQHTRSGQIIWSSQTVENSAISANKDSAIRAAKSEFSDNISFFILPQLERNLGY